MLNIAVTANTPLCSCNGPVRFGTLTSTDKALMQVTETDLRDVASCPQGSVHTAGRVIRVIIRPHA